ncbi:MAG: hypothetical protein ACYST3_09565 [Planctomycetota bacterium]|jgi:hypothetical protein
MYKVIQKHPYVLTIIVSAFLLTLFIIGYSVYFTYSYKKVIDLRLEGDWAMESDNLMGYTATKNASTLRRHIKKGLIYHLHTDRRGARINAKGQQTSDSVSIMTIGGSFSWGHGMENEQTFTEILGRKLNVPVANFAYGSYGTLQSLQILQRNTDLKPKVVIYGFIKDHLRRNLSPCARNYTPFCLPRASVSFDEQGKPYIKSPPMEYSPEIAQKVYEIVARKDISFDNIVWGAKGIFSKLYRRYKLTPSNDYVSRKKGMKYLMNMMIEEAKSIDAKLVVIHIPYLTRNGTNPPPLELMISLNQDVIFIDLTPIIIQYYSDSKNPSLFLLNDGHPNHLAHELIAHKIYTTLKEKNIF